MILWQKIFKLNYASSWRMLIGEHLSRWITSIEQNKREIWRFDSWSAKVLSNITVDDDFNSTGQIEFIFFLFSELGRLTLGIGTYGGVRDNQKIIDSIHIDALQGID